MVYWGNGLFQNSVDREILDELADEAEVDSFLFPEDVEDVRRTLNDGTLKRLLIKLNRSEPRITMNNSIRSPPGSSDYHDYCILAAAAMKVGATIDEEDMEQLRRVCENAGFFALGLAQSKMALDGYKNGIEWDFRASLLDIVTRNLQDPSRIVVPNANALMLDSPIVETSTVGNAARTWYSMAAEASMKVEETSGGSGDEWSSCDEETVDPTDMVLAGKNSSKTNEKVGRQQKRKNNRTKGRR